jgi:hypothetical protein
MQRKNSVFFSRSKLPKHDGGSARWISIEEATREVAFLNNTHLIYTNRAVALTDNLLTPTLDEQSGTMKEESLEQLNPSSPTVKEYKKELRKNAVVFWKSKITKSCGGGLRLLSIEDAAKEASFFNKTDPYNIYIAMPLTDKQLQLITDKQSRTIKKEKSLDQFNPFSPKIRRYEKEKKLFKIQKELFAQGLYLKDSHKVEGQKNQSLLKLALAQNETFDAALIKQELFSFLEPVHPFEPKTSSSLISSPVPLARKLKPLSTATFYQPNEQKKIAQKLINYSKTQKNISLEVYTALVRKAVAEKVINKTADDQKTALYLALAAEKFERAKILLEAGADPNIMTSSGDTALKLAKRIATKSPVPFKLKEILDLLFLPPETPMVTIEAAYKAQL